MPAYGVQGGVLLDDRPPVPPSDQPYRDLARAIITQAYCEQASKSEAVRMAATEYLLSAECDKLLHLLGLEIQGVQITGRDLMAAYHADPTTANIRNFSKTKDRAYRQRAKMMA